jgi:nitrate reductase gamma subunit
LVVLLVGRVVVRSARKLTRTRDVLLLVVLLLTVLFGYLAAHPTQSPFAARSILLFHILGGNLVLVLIPTTKIAHCVLYPFTQLLFQLGWHFPAETGRHVAIALAKEDEPI